MSHSSVVYCVHCRLAITPAPWFASVDWIHVLTGAAPCANASTTATPDDPALVPAADDEDWGEW
jgi:hypothetical protein